MKLDNMFKKTRRPSGKKGHIGGKHQSPEVPEGLLCKCNKCQKAIDRIRSGAGMRKYP